MQYNYQYTKISCMYINTLDDALQFNNNHLFMWKIQWYYHNNKIQISALNREKLTALSLAWLAEYNTWDK